MHPNFSYHRLAKGLALFAVGFVLFMASGCMRIGYEFEKGHFMRPSKTLFIGVKKCGEAEKLFSPLGIIMFPGELVADIILMPMELFRRTCYPKKSS